MRLRDSAGLFLPLLCTYLVLIPEYSKLSSVVGTVVQYDDLPSMTAVMTEAAYNLRRSVPPFIIDPMYQVEHQRIDSEDVATKCKRYNLEPYDGPPRRIFFGAMVADESWDLYRIHAVEVYDVYHAAVFVESNTTHIASPRKMRFTPNSPDHDLLVGAKLFGQKTKVHMNQWLEHMPNLLGMNREAEQRNSIIKGWKEAGMTREDVGLMADVDEFFSRDFLRAVQTCDLPQLRTDDASCHRPKIVPIAISYESSPFCVQNKYWFHPDLMGGKCIEGVGDPTERVVPLRNYDREFGERDETYGVLDTEQYPDSIKESNRYPLFNGPDMRTVAGDTGPYTIADRPGDEETAVYGAAYHMHNWFQDLGTLRSKYATFAHGDEGILKLPLAQVNEQMDLVVRCVHRLGNEVNDLEWKQDYFLNSRDLEGTKPIFFVNETYLHERHDQLTQLIVQDEKEFGLSYDASGKWIGRQG